MSSVFDDLIDQEAVIAILKDAVAASKDSTNNSQEMTHSWLFTGPPGSGRSNAAIAFAAALLCEKSGCNLCTNCLTVKDGSHADIELIRTDGLSIKVDEVRELITRTSWSPSVGNYRVVVIEDADRLTESAANALLKVIEEPGARTVWLLCAPTLTDVNPTIRSRCRHLTLRIPSASTVSKLLIESYSIEAKAADFIARVSGGHIGSARRLATDSRAVQNRENILKLPLLIKNLASAFQVAQFLVDSAKTEAKTASEKKDEDELSKMKEAWRAIGSNRVTGGPKVQKELEKDKNYKSTRIVRDYLDRALLELAMLYSDVSIIQSSSTTSVINQDLMEQIKIMAASTNPVKTLQNIEVILKTRRNLAASTTPLLLIEALMCEFL